MENELNLLALLKLFAQKQNKAIVSFAEFSAYMRYYAERNVKNRPEFAAFLRNPEVELQQHISALEIDRTVAIVNADSPRKGIVVVPFYVEKFANLYREIFSNPAIPFPLISDLSRNVPLEIIDRQPIVPALSRLFDEAEDGGQKTPPAPKLYGLVLPRDLPVILFSSETPVTLLLDVAMAKIRHMLRKDESFDTFSLKLRTASPGKDTSVRAFFTQLMHRPSEAMAAIRKAEDGFYFWGQLCFFIRQDYENIKEIPPEGIALLQSVCVMEFAIGYYKNKADLVVQKDAALRILEGLLQKPPYYFSKDTIHGFSDSRGQRLLGQYTEKDLNEFLHTKTTVFSDNNLPELLAFRLHTGEYYYVNKSKVIPLIIRLCADARETIKSGLTKEWYDLYKRFDSVPAMTDKKAYERRIEQELLARAPVLYALLHSNFLSLIYYETLVAKESVKNTLNLFSDGKLLPYSELLMLARSEIITDAKILLPFWYTTPPISWIAAFILRPRRKHKKKKAASKSVPQELLQTERTPEVSNKTARKQEFRKAAENLEKQLIPPGSNLDREILSYITLWNPMLDKKLRANLIDDVNSLTENYMRKKSRNLKVENFTLDRLHVFAQSLIKTSPLQRIQNKEQLEMYIVLYMIKLVKL